MFTVWFPVIVALLHRHASAAVFSDYAAAFRLCAGRVAQTSVGEARRSRRYIESFDLLMQGLILSWTRAGTYPVLPLQVLELGGSGVAEYHDERDGPAPNRTDDHRSFSRCLQEAFGGPKAMQVFSYEEDLRRPMRGLRNGSFDVVLCMEVIEHIHDLSPAELGRSGEFPDLFVSSGRRFMLSEIRRVLRRDGHLLLTTPNAGSVRAMTRMLKHLTPMFFPSHLRELTLNDLGCLLLEAGLAGSPGEALLLDTDPYPPEDPYLEAVTRSLLHDMGINFEALRGTQLLVFTSKSAPVPMEALASTGDVPGVRMMMQAAVAAMQLPPL